MVRFVQLFYSFPDPAVLLWQNVRETLLKFQDEKGPTTAAFGRGRRSAYYSQYNEYELAPQCEHTLARPFGKALHHPSLEYRQVSNVEKYF